MVAVGASGPRSPAGFYGWRIVGLASLVGALTAPGQSIGVSVFREAMAFDLDASDTAVSTAYMVGTLGASTALPRLGRWIDEVGVRRSMTAIAVAFAAVLVHMSVIRHVAWLAVGFLGIRMMGQGALSLAARVSIVHWFERRRGFALGVSMTLTAAGMAVVPLGLSLGVTAWGWRSTWVAAACVMLITVMAIARFGMVDRPSDLGQVPDGRMTDSGGGKDGDGPSPSRAEVLRSPSFWVLAAVASANSLLITGMVFHQTNVLGELGYSDARAAAMFLPQAIGAIAGGLVFGWASDRPGRFLLPAAIALFLAVSCLLGGMGSTTATVFAYSIGLGICTGGGAAINGALLPALFGIRNIGSVSGLLHVVSVVNSALGALTFSLGADLFGSYREALTVFAIWPAGLVLVAIVWHPRLPTPAISPDGGGGDRSRS
jgi:MFS family permease